MTSGNRAALSRKLGYLQKNLEMLSAYRKLTKKEFLSDLEKRLSVERLLQTAIESIIDCSRLLVITENWRPLRDERDALLLFMERKIIPKSLCTRLLRAKAFRNILVHEYIEVDPHLVYLHLQQGTKDLQQFAKHLARWLKK